MKVSSKINLGSLLHFRASFPENDLAEKYASGEPPLRSELFSADQRGATHTLAQLAGLDGAAIMYGHSNKSRRAGIPDRPARSVRA